MNQNNFSMSFTCKLDHCVSAGSKKFFQNEVGCHRWQRVPPTEKRGRVHTSTITVALLESKEYIEVNIDMDDIRIELTRGTGNGGQHKNTTNSCVVMTHIPTGTKVVRDGRNQHRNKDEALTELKKRLNNLYKTGFTDEISRDRKTQIGNGNRGSEKRRTYTQKQDLVVDHITGKTARLKQFMKGKLELMC